MDSRTPERSPSSDAVEFVRFCYRRRRVGWPELYDEMCAVANRGLFRGWGSDELSAEGIGFTLFEMPALATLVHRIVAEEHERRVASTAAVVRVAYAAEVPVIAAEPEPSPVAAPGPPAEPVAEPAAAGLSFAGAPAGA